MERLLEEGGAEKLLDSDPVEFLKVMRQCAGAITGKTPLDSDSWDDPEDWQTEAVALAHGFEALDAKLQRETM